MYSRPPAYQIWRIYLDFWGHDCKKWVWPTFGCKLGQIGPIVMELKLDISCHLLNVYTKFQIGISKHIEEKSGKPGRTDGRTDRRTDRRTDGHCHGIIRPFFKRAYNKMEDNTKTWVYFMRCSVYPTTYVTRQSQASKYMFNLHNINASPGSILLRGKSSRYGAVWIYRSHCPPKNSTRTPRSLAVRAMYGASFVCQFKP